MAKNSKTQSKSKSPAKKPKTPPTPKRAAPGESKSPLKDLVDQINQQFENVNTAFSQVNGSFQVFDNQVRQQASQLDMLYRALDVFMEVVKTELPDYEEKLSATIESRIRESFALREKFTIEMKASKEEGRDPQRIGAVPSNVVEFTKLFDEIGHRVYKELVPEEPEAPEDAAQPGQAEN